MDAVLAGMEIAVRSIINPIKDVFNDEISEGKSRGNGYDVIIDAAFTGNLFFGLMALFVVVDVVNVLLTVFTAGGGTAASLTLKEIIPPILIGVLIGSVLETAVLSGMLTEALSIFLQVGLGIDEDSKFYASGVGIAILSFIDTMLRKPLLNTDYDNFGLVIALIGLMIDIVATEALLGSFMAAFIADLIGYIFITIGLIHTLTTRDPLESTMFGWLEEVISGIAFAYAIFDLLLYSDLFMQFDKGEYHVET